MLPLLHDKLIGINITEMANEEFAITEFDHSYAHLMLLLRDKPGLSQNKLALLDESKAIHNHPFHRETNAE
jgi:hypothetical protein